MPHWRLKNLNFEKKNTYKANFLHKMSLFRKHQCLNLIFIEIRVVNRTSLRFVQFLHFCNLTSFSYMQINFNVTKHFNWGPEPTWWHE